MNPNLKKWLMGIAAGAVNGAATSVTAVIVAPEQFNIHEGLSKLGQMALVSGILGIALYLKQHPVPEDLTETKP